MIIVETEKQVRKKTRRKRERGVMLKKGRKEGVEKRESQRERDV